MTPKGNSDTASLTKKKWDGKQRGHSSAVVSSHPSPSKPPCPAYSVIVLAMASSRMMMHLVPRGRQRGESTGRTRRERGRPRQSQGLIPSHLCAQAKCDVALQPAYLFLVESGLPTQGAVAAVRSLSRGRLFATPWTAAFHGLLHSPRVCSDSCPLSRCCHPTILSTLRMMNLQRGWAQNLPWYRASSQPHHVGGGHSPPGPPRDELS